METLLSVFIGIGLSAAVGFRVFIPFLFASIFSYSGQLQLSTYFSWIGTFPALVAFSVATILEILAYYIPWLDNILDTIEHPMAITAGIILSGSVISDISPFLKWAFAIIAGGGIAGTIQAATGLTRLKTSAMTGGTGNPLLSSVEAGASITLTLIAVFLPVLGIFIVSGLLIWVTTKFYKKFFLRKEES